LYEERAESKNRQKACIDPNWLNEHISIHDRLLNSCSDNPQQFWIVESPKQEIVTLHDNGVNGKIIP